jgi:hypothetical protein
MIEWIDISGYDGVYQVSRSGIVRSLDRISVSSNGVIRRDYGRILSQSKNPKGYMYVNLSKNGYTRGHLVHRLVAQTFLLNDMMKPQVNHIDGNKQNNCVSNLEWATELENISHAFENNLINRERSQYVMMMKPVKCVDLGVVFDSISDATKFVRDNGNPKAYSSKITDCAKGRLITAYGYKWKYDN